LAYCDRASAYSSSDRLTAVCGQKRLIQHNRVLLLPHSQMPSVDPETSVDPPDRRGPYGYVPSGYGAPPPPYYPPPPISEKSGNPYYGQYPPQYHHPQYPGYGNAATGPYMPYGYGAPPPWMTYEGGPPQPPGSSSGLFPSQRSMLTKDRLRSSITGTNSTAPQPPYMGHDANSGKKETGGENHSLSSSQQQQQRIPNLKHMHTAEEMDRLKAAAVAELGMSEVKPIQSDFHFFVSDHRLKLLPLASTEVDQKLEGKSSDFIQKHRSFLIHSNLNCRIMRAWEDLPRPEREEYFKAEEDDRQRFMEEDEVVSRHCFTLTARIRSPTKSRSILEYGDMEDGDMEDDEEEKNETDEVNAETESIDVPEGKRLPDDAPVSEESPAKKNKADGESAAPTTDKNTEMET
jgi:hypothetical protein